ncbi:hypothetical protein F0562_014888 [Nyssa sinensis]|uniref:DUF4283 domain-containing protein n=1 Tax=Nyssa sinensis TaxID=561372 RepID=A0A5J4ZTB6_9ASTE|nr:hypothetical protein F0562_014888 [Nyssa sinensis]
MMKNSESNEREEVPGSVKYKSFKEALKAHGFYSPVLDETQSEDDLEETESGEMEAGTEEKSKLEFPTGDFEAIDLGNGYFLFKFDNMEDCVHVFTGAPWVIMDHYLTVRRWQPNFQPSAAQVLETAVWVRLPELPIEYYDEKILVEIGKCIGKPIIIDANTPVGKHARICVEIDLTKPLETMFELGSNRFIFEYESIHSVCFYCGRMRHTKETCRVKNQAAGGKFPATGDGEDVEAGNQGTMKKIGENELGPLIQSAKAMCLKS